MGRSTVIINGKTYDAISGLPLDESIGVTAEPQTGTPSVSSADQEQTPAANHTDTVKAERRSLSKQERLAAAIQQEFGIAAEESIPVSTSDSESTKSDQVSQSSLETQTSKSTPDWLRQFTEDHTESKTAHQVATVQHETRGISADRPAWIANYVEGGAPIEIEPIGLEKAAKEAQTAARQAATSAGRTPQRSQTLNRNYVTKPAAQKTSFAQTAKTSAPVATHPLVRKFDKVQIPVTKKPRNHTAKDSIAAPQPVLTPGAARHLSESRPKSLSDSIKQESAPVKSGSSLKDALINEQLSKTDQKLSKREQKKLSKEARRQTKRRFHASTLVTAGMVVAIFGGFLTYTQMPNISVRVAANKAGIDAKNPYMPSGYSIDGSVAYSRGSVTINYKSNGGGEGYSFTQQRNDSGNISVDRSDSGDYETLMTGDLVIYRYGDRATWSDSGILYTLNGNGHLSDNQILEIARSV